MTEFQRNQQAFAERHALNIAARQRDEDKARAALAAQKAAARIQRDEEERAAKLKATQLANEALMSRLQTSTNASYNNEMLRQAAAAKKPTVKVVTTDKDGTKTTRDLTPAQHAAELKAQNAPEIARIQAELDNHAREIAGGDKRYGLFNLFSRGNKVADLKGELAALQPPVDTLAVDPVAAAAAAVAPGSIQSGVASGFNGTTSLSGRDFAPVKSYGFIGKPGGPNLFRDRWDPVEAAAAQAPDLTQGSFPSGYEPSHGSFQMDAAAPAQEYADPVAAAAAPTPAPVVEDIRRGRPAVVNLEDPTVGEPVAATSPEIPDSHIKHLLANPDTAKFFNAKYGDGAAEKLLEADRQP